MDCRKLLLSSLVLIAVAELRALAAEPKIEASGIEFFEKQVRPLFVDHCVKCHGPDKQKGGLRLDSRDAVLAGGDHGAAVVPKEPDKSRLVTAVRYSGDLHMPPKAKLSAEQVEALAAWVKMGAPWSKAAEVRPATAGSAFKITAKDREFWSFRPVRLPSIPSVKDTTWPRS